MAQRERPEFVPARPFGFVPMRLNRLQALRAVMETGSVTEASRRIHRTQPQILSLIHI